MGISNAKMSTFAISMGAAVLRLSMAPYRSKPGARGFERVLEIALEIPKESGGRDTRVKNASTWSYHIQTLHTSGELPAQLQAVTKDVSSRAFNKISEGVFKTLCTKLRAHFGLY